MLFITNEGFTEVLQEGSACIRSMIVNVQQALTWMQVDCTDGVALVVAVLKPIA